MAKYPDHLVFMRAKREGECFKCPYPIWKGALMVWNKKKKKARHQKCPYTKPASFGRARFVTGRER